MSYHEYLVSQELIKKDPPFYALIMTAMRKADRTNSILLANIFPNQWHELQARYDAPGGLLQGES